MPLTHIQITHAKPRDRAYKLADSDALYLVINPNGTKLWRMNYLYLGCQKTLYFGEWPTVSLADARAQRDEARRQIASGLDPVTEKKADRFAQQIAAAIARGSCLSSPPAIVIWFVLPDFARGSSV